MKYKAGDKVSVLVPAFKEMFGENSVWVIDHIRTQIKKPSLYVAYRRGDKNKTLFHFLECEVTEITKK